MLTALLLPLLAAFALVRCASHDGSDMPSLSTAGSSHTLLKHLDETLLNAPWVAFEEAEAYTSHTKSAIDAVEGSPAAAAVVRVELTADAPVRAVYAAFVKPEMTAQWNSLVGEVRKLSGSTQLQTYKFPWPLASREYLVECSEQALRGQGFRTHCAPTEHPKAPRRADRVRGMSETLWQFTPAAADPQRTTILFEGLVDPKGNVPKWMVNEIGKRASVSMVLALARVAQAHAGRKPAAPHARRALGSLTSHAADDSSASLSTCTGGSLALCRSPPAGSAPPPAGGSGADATAAEWTAAVGLACLACLACLCAAARPRLLQPATAARPAGSKPKGALQLFS